MTAESVRTWRRDLVRVIADPHYSFVAVVCCHQDPHISSSALLRFHIPSLTAMNNVGLKQCDILPSIESSILPHPYTRDQ